MTASAMSGMRRSSSSIRRSVSHGATPMAPHLARMRATCALGLWTPGEKEFGDEGGRHVHFALSVSPGSLDYACRRLSDLGIDFQGPVEHPGGDRSLYCEDPAGNVLEPWAFFHRGEGAHGVGALAASRG
jgi:hypothetical protein